jgi:hypothetical protein
MLIDVITRLAQDIGYDAVRNRDKLDKLANQAATEIYQELDCNRIKREVSCLVGRNMLVALPYFIGELQGMRQCASEQLIPLMPMVPRYASDTLAYKWKNWRDIGESPFHTLPQSIDTLTFETNVIADSAVVRVTGRTNVAAREAEDVTLDSTPKDTTKLWDPAGVTAISSASVRTSDITVLDSNGVEVAVLYNNQQKTRYKMVDVSKLFWGADNAEDQTVIDILYKAPLFYLSDDSDSFPGGDIYDDAWYYRAMAIHFNSKPTLNTSLAATNRTMSLVQLRNIKDGSERGIVKKIEFGRNKYMRRDNYNTFDSYGQFWQDRYYQ